MNPVTRKLCTRKWNTRIAIGLATAALAATVTVANSTPAPATPRQPAEPHMQNADWTARLEALTPEKPMEYFELAEVIADQAADESEREIARQLFGLAGVLDRIRLGRSACLALADLATTEIERKQLRALAALLDHNGEEYILEDTLVSSANELDTEVIVGFGIALSEYRTGKGTRAIAQVRDQEIAAVFDRFNFLFPGGAERFEEDCSRLRGNMKPLVDGETLNRQLQLEHALLAGDDRSWSADLVVTQNAPLVDVDPSDLERSLGVSARESVYRNGRWTIPILRAP